MSSGRSPACRAACRERQQRRSAAREREEEQEYRWRDLHTQQRQMQGHCRTVSSYEQAGKAERLLDTQRALELTSKAQQDQDALLKVAAVLSVPKSDRTCACCAGLRNHPPAKVPIGASPRHMGRCAGTWWSLIAA